MRNFILSLYYFIRKVHIQVVEYKVNATTQSIFLKTISNKAADMLY